MGKELAIVVTKVDEVEDSHCDHGCKQVVRLTNIIDDTTWEFCILSFENFAGRALQSIDYHARGAAITTKIDRAED